MAFLINISFGSVEISIKTILESVFGPTTHNNPLDYIIHHYRIPKAITAVVVGAGLSISGLLMQTYLKTHWLDHMYWVLVQGQAWEPHCTLWVLLRWVLFYRNGS